MAATKPQERWQCHRYRLVGCRRPCGSVRRLLELMETLTEFGRFQVNRVTYPRQVRRLTVSSVFSPAHITLLSNAGSRTVEVTIQNNAFFNARRIGEFLMTHLQAQGVVRKGESSRAGCV